MKSQSMKQETRQGRDENVADKKSFRSTNDRAKAGFFNSARRSENRNKQESK